MNTVKHTKKHMIISFVDSGNRPSRFLVNKPVVCKACGKKIQSAFKKRDSSFDFFHVPCVLDDDPAFILYEREKK